MSAPRFERVLLLGGGGLLGRGVAALWGGVVSREAVALAHPSRATADITDKRAIAQAVADASPDLIINCAAMANVEGAEDDQIHAFMVNAVAVENLAKLAIEHGSALLHISTDYVFDGEKESAYTEEDLCDPHSVYGGSKRAGEKAILASGLENAWIVRTSWLHGRGGGHFPAMIARLARRQEEITIVDDQRGSPTSTPLVAESLLTVTGIDGGEGIAPGLLHIAGRGECSWYDLALRVVAELRARGEKLAVERVTAVSTEEYAKRSRAAGKIPPQAPRPARSTLDCRRYETLSGKTLPTWEEALVREMSGDLASYLESGPAADAGQAEDTREAEST